MNKKWFFRYIIIGLILGCSLAVIVKVFAQSYPTESCVASISSSSPLAMASCTSGIPIPEGNTAARSFLLGVATIRYNTDTALLEYSTTGSSWASLQTSINQAFEGTTQRLNPILINKTAAVADGAGNAVFNITNDGTSTGTSLCPNGVMLNSPNLSVNDAAAPYQFGWTWSNSNKTLTVLVQKASGLAVLTFTLLGIPAPVPNGTNVNTTIICY